MGRLITLLTDFGLQDHYVAVMKGVIYDKAPEVKVVDITHMIMPQNIHHGGIVLQNSYSYFPKKTIHVVVVDPTVGTQRKILAACFNDHYFIAPDNGLLSYLFKDQKPQEIVEVDNDAYFLNQVSNTFHGRDIFAPVAASLSMGVSLNQLGNSQKNWVKVSQVRPEITEDNDCVVGEVLYIDHFGNLITNIHSKDVKGYTWIYIKDKEIIGLSSTYHQKPHHKPIALIGSSDYLEIAYPSGNASKILNAGIKDKVTVSFSRQNME